MYYSKPMKQIKREMYARKHATRVSIREAVKEYAIGFFVVAFIFAAILGWMMALSQPTCAMDYHTGITQCV
jgi:uncharacterized membrane protein SpoIIM required for sporulation